MKILKHGSRIRVNLTGGCQRCGCVVEVNAKATKELIDRDTEAGMATRYVHCPDCDNEYLWVK